MKQANGKWVTGNNFWGRESDKKILTRKIDEGGHILLTAQRRMGKTSLMKELQRILMDRYLCIYVDLQDDSSAEDAIVAISLELRDHEGLWGKVGRIFSNFIPQLLDKIEEINLSEIGIKLRSALSSANWQEKGDRLFDFLAESERPVLLMMDEFPILINRILVDEEFKPRANGRENADTFLSWLRKNGNKHQDKIRIILSGSIGLEPILRRAGLSATANTYPPFELKPWDRETAIGCLQALAREYNLIFHDQAEAAMVDRLGYCIPHHVQMFFSHVLDYCDRRGKKEFQAAEVDEVYNREMLSVRGHAEMSHYEERLKSVLGPELFSFALELLTETACAGSLSAKALKSLTRFYNFSSATADSATKEVMLVLEHDGYLKPSEEGYVFISTLLKDWWQARHGFGYIPILKRGIQS
ncbi:hypothetical protein LJC24_00310 [Desulfococcaceae bacterium OttesenSCG-928-F15]|nr:hypothetical protein [Desulfococcaceae bacterium OttesenSCG-928-F15]